MVNVFKLAKQVPVESVIKKYVQLKEKGDYYVGLCPFHNDRHLGSFNVFGTGFKCWACGASGDAIDFVSKHLNISGLEAAVFIAEEAGLLTSADAKEILDQRSISQTYTAPKGTPLNCTQLAQVYLSPKADAEQLDKVYKCFVASACPLTEEYRVELLENRKVPVSSLGKYFLFPQRHERKIFWSRFETRLKEDFHLDRDSEIEHLLLGVPGFFLSNFGAITFTIPKGANLGIVVQDRNGMVSGIQTRAMGDVSKKERYKFLSSGFANGTPKSIGKLGCSCNYVEDVVMPVDKWNHAIALTEGRFKAEILAKYGFLVVNLHSISNWEPASAVTLDLAKKYNPTQFVLCYDSEFGTPVFDSAHNLYKKLYGSLPVEFAVWDSKYGKGIDDVINAGFIKKITRISPSEFFGRAS